MKINIRFTKPEDYSEISKLGTNSYKDNYYEGEEGFISKMEGCPEGCFVADVDGIIGYIISFPYLIGKSFPIDSFFVKTENPNCWYIHDLCVSKDFRKKGVGRELAATVIKTQKTLALTAIQESEDFWYKMGFRSFFNLDYCGSKAKYMILLHN